MSRYKMTWETEMDRFKDAGQLIDWQRRREKEIPMSMTDAEIAGSIYASFHIRALPLAKSQAEWLWNLVHPFYGALMQHVHCDAPLHERRQRMFRLEYPNGNAIYFPLSRAHFVWDQLGLSNRIVGTRVKLLSMIDVDTVSREVHFDTLWQISPEKTISFPNLRIINMVGPHSDANIICCHTENGVEINGKPMIHPNAPPYQDGGSWAKLTELVWLDTGCLIV